MTYNYFYGVEKMSKDQDNGFLAGRLLQWGLDPRARPSQEPEYRELIEEVKPGQPVALHVLVRRTGRVSVAGPFRRPRE